jgi:peptidyl-prolyl cis-trans isomerase C
MKRRYKYHLILTLFVLILLTTENLPQSDKTVATVGNHKILFEEFKHRFELTPGFSLGTKGNEISEKQNFLFTLIAEYLWAEEANARGFDTTLIMRFTFPAIQKMYLRNELFKQEIESKVSVTEKELLQAIEKEKYKLILNFIHSNDSTEIFSLFKQLKSGINFDSIFSKRDEALLQSIPLEVTFGKLDSELESFLYELTKGSYSIPFLKKEGWFIYYLRDKVDNIVQGKDIKQRISNTKSILNERRTDEVYQQFYKKFFSNTKIETNGDLFWSLFDKINEIYSKVKNNDSINSKQSYKISVGDIRSIEKAFGADTLSMTFIEIDNQKLSLQSFIRNFIFDGFYSEPVSDQVLSAKLNQRVRTFIEQELLAIEAEKRGLQNIPEVKSAIERWKKFYLAEEFRYSFTDSIKISQQEVEDYYIESKGDSLMLIQVNIAEILTDNLEVVELILRELEQGKDFLELAKIHTKRTWNRENGGILGMMPAASLGEKGRIASQLEIGEVYGPISTHEGYSIFKLIDKKRESIITKSFDEVKSELRQEYGYKKIENFLKEKTIEFADKYGVSLNEDLLYNTQVKNLQMYVIQYMGFGGRLPAVPTTTPFIKWYEDFKKKKELP